MQVNAVSCCCCCSRALLISLTRIRKTFHVLLSCASSVIRREFYAPTFILQHTATELDRAVDDRVRSREPMMTAIAKPCVSVSDLFSLCLSLSPSLAYGKKCDLSLPSSIRQHQGPAGSDSDDDRMCGLFFFVSLLLHTSPSCQQPSPPISRHNI